MKNPLHYQFTEYDCGPTSLMNAICFLFEREEIPPEVIRNIQLYCLDTIGQDGTQGRMGTSRMAMMFLSNWLECFGQADRLPVTSTYLHGESVFIGEDSRINEALYRGGVAIVRLFLEGEHYVLLTGSKEGNLYVFDPYLCEPEGEQPYQVDTTHPYEYNRIVPFEVFNSESHADYALGEVYAREAVLIYNKKTIKSAEKTIEYFI